MIFSRPGSPKAVAAIADFWGWWPQARVRAEKSTSAGVWDDSLVRDINKKVKAIHRDLQWEFGRGATSQHALVVCAPGEPSLRAIAERWRAAAPPSDATWCYHASRQPEPDVATSVLKIDEHSVAMEKMRFGVEIDTDRHEIDIATFHPIFSVMTDQQRLQVTLLTLDWALGESDVEVWVGQISANRTEPQRPHTIAQLRSAMMNLTQKFSEDDWAVLSWPTPDGKPKTASARRPLKPGRFPRFDTHLRVELRFADSFNGLPGDESLAAMRDFEDRLVAALSPDGALVAQETWQGRRHLHLYVDGVTKAADIAKRFLRQWPAGRATIATSYDPGWDAVGHLRPY